MATNADTYHYTRDRDGLLVNRAGEHLWEASGGTVRVQDMETSHLMRARRFAEKRNRKLAVLFDNYIAARQSGRIRQGEQLPPDNQLYDIGKRMVIV